MKLLRLGGGLLFAIALICSIIVETSLQQLHLDASQLASQFKPAQASSSGGTDSDTISVVMRTLMPSMFNLFNNITPAEYKAQFQEPCRFDSLLEIFSQLPAYFDIIAKKYNPKGDLVAYYSMQLASTFLVNNDSLTMTCLYNMMSLQSRLKTFSLDLMDNPEKNFHLVGLFGYFIKPVMGMLKQNAMMKIIDHVEKYDSNEDLSTVTKFNVLNAVFVVLGIVAILANTLLVVLLRRSGLTTKKPPKTLNKPAKPSIYKNSALMNQQQVDSKPKKSQYKIVKSQNYYLNQFIRRKYTTRECLMIIAVCHSMYILINYIVMSQTSLASQALKGLTKLNFACKLAFFLSPPTTAYNILHQFAIWLLVYAIRKHANKLRATKTHGARIDDQICMNFEESEETEDGSNTETQSDDYDHRTKRYRRNLYEEQNDTLSQSLTNNSHSIKPIQTIQLQKSSVHFISEDNNNNNNNGAASGPRQTTQNGPNRYALVPASANGGVIHPATASTLTNTTSAGSPHQNHHHHHHQTPVQIVTANYYHQANVFTVPYNNNKAAQKSKSKQRMSSARQNYIFCIILLALLLVYNAQNLFLYKLNELNTGIQTILFCAFDDTYADYYSMLTQFVVPFLNLTLFAILPLTLLTVQVLLDVCFLIRVKREQMKRYMKLNEVIEWPLYLYYAVYMISQLPFALHQLFDLAAGTAKFPFVFPLFIQMKFSSHVWLVIVEQVLIFAAYSSDLFIWLLADKQMRELCSYWLNKRILCRTYSKDSSATGSSTASTRSCASKSSSDSSVINDESIKTQTGQLQTQTTVDLRPNSYASSTLTSTSSSNTASKKKQLSANIADGVKASAALSAASTHQVYSYDNDAEIINGGGNMINSIKMIDTDNDDIDMVNDCLIEQQPMGKPNQQYLTRLSEQDLENGNGLPNLDALKMSNNAKHHYSFNNYDISPHPPSFKTAVGSRTAGVPLLKSSRETSRTPPDLNKSHQYQNDDFDLDIHNTK